VVLEAAAAGLPVIGTRVGGVPEIFGPYADNLVPADNIAALVAALRKAVIDPGEAAGIAERIRERVRAEFSVDRMVDGGLAAYREALTLRKLAQFT
jgi:glycosyltransferase involved in cell wall biosynthesis